MKDDKGVTLVELIVVIAIMAILAGTVALSSGIIYSWQLNSGAKAFESMYSKSRLQAMAKADVTGMSLYEEDSQLTYGIHKTDDTFTNDVSINGKIEVWVQLEKIDGSGIVQVYQVENTGVTRPIIPTITSTSINIATFSFVKGTGAEKGVTYNSSLDPSQNGDYYITQVKLTLGSKELSYSIEPATGNLTQD